MNYVPVNGIKVLVVETCTLFAAFAVTFIFIHLINPSVSWPRWLDWVLARNLRGVLAVVAVALCGRAVVLPFIGIPQPRINDEYSYLLMADTFAHHRLTNPTPPAWQHFETFHVNLTPTYHSKYPVSQGLVLAFGEIAFHQPWFGVYLSTALMCGAICWCLQAFVSPGWALLGGFLAATRLALFSYWMNSYWGGSMAALGGAVALGTAVRLFQPALSSRRRFVYACAFAISLLILATSRPYEGFAFSTPLLLYFVYQTVRARLAGKKILLATLVPVAVLGAIGIALMGAYNRATTGDPLLLPHLLNERTYSPLPLFLGQKPKLGMVFRDPVFEKFFRVTEEEYRYGDIKSVGNLIGLEAGRFGVDWFFFVGPALSFPVLVGLLLSLRDRRLWVVAFVALSTGIALALCIYSMPHYAAAATVVVYVFGMEGMRYLWEQGKHGERALVIAICVTVIIVSITRQTGSSAINNRFILPDTRTLVVRQLKDKPGMHLVLVSYDLAKHYPGNELVHNGADFNAEKILWVRSKGSQGDLELCRDYSNRTFWTVTTDDNNLALSPLDLCK